MNIEHPNESGFNRLQNRLKSFVPGVPSSHEALGLLSDKNVLGAALISFDGEVHSINDYYLTEILGYTRADFERDGLNICELTPQAYRDISPYWEEFHRTGKIKAIERPRYRKDGSIVWTLVGYAGLDDGSEMMSSWALDITDKKRAEMTSQYLLEANNIMASSLELQPLLEKIVGVTLVNGFSDFCTIHFPEGEDGLTCRALIHKDPVLTLQVKRIIERFPRYLSDVIGPARVIRTGRSEMSLRGRKPLSTDQRFNSIPALVLKSYMSVPLTMHGKTIGALTLTSMSRQFDPEDLKTAEALALRASQHIENAKLLEDLKHSKLELEQSNRDLSYYASIAAHDLKSPLATSQSYLNVLLDECENSLNETQKFWLHKAIESSQKMLSQVDRLLSFSHFQASEDLTQTVCVSSAVRLAIENLQGELVDLDAEFVYPDLPMVRGDATLLNLLFQNLISNSIRYRNEGPLRIKIEARRSEAGWIFSVIDNGRGFDSKCAEKIFSLFERGSEGEVTEGHGIGLSTCRKIIKAHNGKIWAESTIGQGAKFSFILPD